MTAPGSAELALSPARRSARIGRPRPETIWTAVLALILAVLILAPLSAVLSGAFRDEGRLSLGYFASVLASGHVIANTFLVGTLTTLLATLVGGVLALLVARVAIPGRALLEQLIVVPLYVTPLLTAISWSWLGSAQGGILNRLATALGFAPFVNLHSAAGIIFVSGLAYAPVAFLLIGGSLRAMDPALEDCARVHGARLRSSLVRVTLPLVLPSALGAALLVFVQMIGLFSVPAVLGMPADFYVVGTEIYRLLNNYPPRLGLAGAWAVSLLAVTMLLVWLNAFVLRRFSFATVTGKAYRPRLIRPGKWGPALSAICWVYVLLSVVLPVLTLLWASLINFITVDPRLMAFDLRHFRYVLFEYPKTYIAATNSLLLAVLAATAVCALGLVLAWIVLRGRSAFGGLIDQVGTMPLAIPPMVLALGILWTYVGLTWLPVYGTILILLIAYVTHYLPIGLRGLSGALRQIHPDLEDASRVSGAGLLATLRLVVLPLARPTLVATWTLLFVLSLQEVSSSILLYTSRTTVLSVAVFDLWEAGNVNALAALGTLQLLLTFAVLLLLARKRMRGVAA